MPVNLAPVHPHLRLFHTTRHTGGRHFARQNRDLVASSVERGVSLRPAWIERFDWILHHALDWNLESGATAVTKPDALELRLTRLRDRPRSVLVHNSRGLRPFLEGVLPQLEHPIALYLGAGSFLSVADAHPRAVLDELLEDRRIASIFSENKAIDDERVIAMPIGVSFPEILRYGPQLLELQSRVEIDEKSPKVLAGWWQELPVRKKATEFAVANADLCDYEDRKLPPVAYWRRLSQHRFVMSPPGKGMDCYRTYEALAVKSIPIVERCNGLYAEVFRGLPVVVIDDYREITRDNLERWWHDLAPALDSADRFVRSDYWWDRIERELARPPGV